MVKATIFFLSALFLSFAMASKSEVRIADKSTVRVGEPIRLGTLMKGQIDDSELSDRIYNLVVFEAFTDEVEKTFESEELAYTLRQKLSFQDLQRVSIKIPRNFKIKGKRNFLYQGDLMREISNQALSLCSDCTVEFDDLKMPALDIKGEILRVRLETQTLKAAGSFLLPLVVETSQGRSSFWVTGKISLYKLAPVAKRLLRANERITEADFEMKRVNVSFAKDGVPSADSLAGKLTARLLTLGQPIFEADLKKEKAAKRGQTIKIVVGDEGFEIVSSGVAQEAGSLGDSIKVKMSDTQKLLSGVLTDNGVVRLQ